MNALGRGALLAGRYRLEERLAETDGSSLWRGVDTTLDREVAIRLIAPRTAHEALDAARRAALLDDPRLVRLLDVAHTTTPQEPGHTSAEATHTYVVSEWVDGRSLADLLTDGGPLPADRVRTLIGEAAEALAAAARRGLHHLALDPTSVLLTRDGAVRVQGLAVDAAARGGAQPDGAAAERVDAVSLVALLYAGLTGKWPLPNASHTGDTALEPAPIVGNSPVVPTEVNSGVPGDLNSLCAVTFGPNSDGPTSPAELARQLKPWGAPGSPGVVMTANRRLADDLRAAPRRPASRFPVQLNHYHDDEEPYDEQNSDLFDDRRAASRQPSAPSPATSPATPAVTPAARQEEPKTFDPTGRLRAVPREETSGPAPAATGAAAAAAATTRPAATGAATTGATTGATTHGGGPDRPLPDNRPQEPAEPRRPAVDTQPTRRRSWAWVPVLAVVALLCVGLFLAVKGLSGSGQTAAEPTATPSASTSTTQAPVGVKPKISEASGFDPEGDDAENNSRAQNAIDGDPDTTWRSNRYNTAAFGNLKTGVGLIVKLEEQSSISKISVTVEGSGGAVEVRTANSEKLDGSQVVASGPAGTLEKTLNPPANAQYVIVWFTELPDVDGSYRGVISDVKVS